ncbi:MAG: hypothetical protein A2174_03560 [Candidatus Portnoybacteria bacterium RBG_13_41_18]|uniref:Uncharacterized protein n=1 Tax=Candidatus Portnoybacteria bacterium RBG_13_41_18 TaxID=1801991 RepID=A0A1G2F9E8_9BACT|nr:MAG: hypothetical protein A2174_03560 [Candidatus Portnoybacteria bacterium RBG_13_41_18]
MSNGGEKLLFGPPKSNQKALAAFKNKKIGFGSRRNQLCTPLLRGPKAQHADFCLRLISIFNYFFAMANSK